MSVSIKSIYQKLFPARQLLIRQNGEVKHVVLAPRFQLIASLVVLVTITWVCISSYSVYTQTKQIAQIEQTQLSKQTIWKEKVAKQQQLNQQQLEQLAILEQKQALLQSMMESLPASISQDNINVNDELSSPVEESKSDFHEPLVEENEQAKHALNIEAISFESRIAQLNEHYEQNFTYLENQINDRHDAILTMLQGAGLEAALDKYMSVSNQEAQGGPLNVFDESKIPNHFLNVVDKLLALNNLENFLTELPNALPLPAAKYYVSSSFGLRKDPMNNRRAFHKGVDLAGWHKTEIFAPADATVLRAGRNGGYGNFIELEHKNGLVTRFGHLNKIKVKKGQQVAKNDVIGLMGSTGRSTSTHLHYEVLLNGKQVNPLKITKALSLVR